MSWIDDDQVHGFLTVGYGKRIHLGNVGGYPSEEFWVSPDAGSVLYQAFRGRGKTPVVCYSNFYPANVRGKVEDGVNEALGRLELVSHRSYERGIVPVDADSRLGGLLASELFGGLQVEVAGVLDDQEKRLAEIEEIARRNPVGLHKRRKERRKMMAKILKEKVALSVPNMIKRGFNIKTAAHAIDVQEAGRYEAYNKEGTKITSLFGVAVELKNKQQR